MDRAAVLQLGKDVKSFLLKKERNSAIKQISLTIFGLVLFYLYGSGEISSANSTTENLLQLKTRGEFLGNLKYKLLGYFPQLDVYEIILFQILMLRAILAACCAFKTVSVARCLSTSSVPMKYPSCLGLPWLPSGNVITPSPSTLPF